jgi:hypothetical protein
LRDIIPEIEERGAHLVVIGNGLPAQARDMQEDLEFPGPVWIDAEMTAYRAAGLRRGPTRTLSWRTLGHLVRAWRGGHRQVGVQGDPWQLGGTFVIAPPHEVHYAQISREAGDHPPVPDLLVALERAHKPNG